MAGPWDVVADVFGLGEANGNDHGSSNWAAWGHQEICSMLDISVDPGDIGDAARAWSDQARNDADIVTGLARDLQQIVSGGWRGASAEAAITALGPINDWVASVARVGDHTTALMDASGFSAGQAKAAVPPAISHDWGQSLRSFALAGPVGVVIDAVAQDQAQSEAHAEAVRIMNNVYSAPINDHRTEVPIYPQLTDPTLLLPEPSPGIGPAPGAGQLGGGASAPGGGVAGIHASHSQLATAHLQGVASGGAAGSADFSGGSIVPGHTTGPRQLPGGQVAAGAAAASVPIMAPIAGGGEARQARRAGGVLPGVGRAGGGHADSGGRAAGGSGRTGSAAEFGPRRSVVATGIAEGRVGAGLGLGANAAAAGRVGVGDLMAPLGGGRDKDGEDTQHRRPSYLIEMEDVFTDGRKVAPPVIGEDPPEREGRR